AEAVQAARAIGDEWACAHALAGLAPRLPPELLAEALQAARAIRDGRARARALAGLAPRLAALPRQHLASLWTDTLHLLAKHTRPDLVAALRALAPVLVALAGPDPGAELAEVPQAVLDVARWWP